MHRRLGIVPLVLASGCSWEEGQKECVILVYAEGVFAKGLLLASIRSSVYSVAFICHFGSLPTYLHTLQLPSATRLRKGTLR